MLDAPVGLGGRGLDNIDGVGTGKDSLPAVRSAGGLAARLAARGPVFETAPRCDLARVSTMLDDTAAMKLKKSEQESEKGRNVDEAHDLH